MFSALTQIVICQVHETGVQEEKWRVKAGKKGTEHILFESQHHRVASVLEEASARNCLSPIWS